MARLVYLTHPEVAIDPAVPVSRWGLSDVGRARVGSILDRPWVAAMGRIVSSDETKAVETARLLGDRAGVDVEIRTGIGENDRSATGFVTPDEFERLADAFFAEPEVSVRGWERAVDAQRRIADGLADLLDPGAEPDRAEPAGDTLVVGHGGVGTLWWCHLTGRPVDRRHDQPGQGHHFAVDLTTGRVLHPWRPLEEDPG